jgi:hypothetical protein
MKKAAYSNGFLVNSKSGPDFSCGTRIDIYAFPTPSVRAMYIPYTGNKNYIKRLLLIKPKKKYTRPKIKNPATSTFFAPILSTIIPAGIEKIA